jgi:hypothetical protein
MGDTKRTGQGYIAAALLFASLTMVRAPAAFSQTMTTGGAVGTAADASGAVVSGAKVAIHLADANETNWVVTNATGEYRFFAPDAGRLHLDRGSQRLEIHNRRIVISGCGVPFQRAVNG